MEIYRNGGITAPFSGSVSSVDYDETAVTSDTETALLTVSPDKSMQLSVNVDEKNILSLELGQRASVTINSIGDEVFDGSVTEINKTASSASGVTRYSAVVTLDKTDAMLQGMSAKAVIRIQGVDNAVIIPVEALHQTSSKSFVYTSYDEELKEFGGLKEVTVGITNSNSAEITSGLQAGDTVWYTEVETNPFGNMNFPGGGSFPSDGNFPGGGGGMPGMGSGDRPNMGSGDRPNMGGGSGNGFRPNGGMPGGNN
jgi:RND family efflux transporter MFP subunit